MDRVLSLIVDLRCISSFSFIPLEPYPARSARHLPLEGKALSVGNTAFPTQPPPLRGTSFQRKEGVSTRAPSLGRGCRAQRGGVGFLFGRRSPLLFAFSLGKGVVSRKAVSSYRSLPHWGRLCFGIAVFTKYGKPVNLLTYEDTHRVLSPRSHRTRRWMERSGQ